jgi:hypothetical protein
MSVSSDLPFWKPPPPTRKDLRQFGILFAVISGILTGWLYWTDKAFTIPLIAMCALVVVSLALPRLLTPAWWPWMVFVRVLGFVNSHLLLAIVFYVLFLPIGLIMRLIGRDPLGERDFRKARQVADSGGSLWQRREEEQLALHHYERQF